MYNIKRTALLILILISLIACSQQSTPTLPPLAKTPPRPAWRGEWEKTLATAKSEGKLVIPTTGGTEVKAALSKTFKEKFGIDIEFVSGRGPELTAKLLAERRAGLFINDLFLAGAMTPITILKPADVLAPIKPLLLLPEVIDAKAYFDDEIPFVDKEAMYIICNGPYVAMTLAINSDLVKPGEIKGYADLLEPKWRGKIILNDPTVIGAASRWFLMTAAMIMNPDFHQQVVKQDPIVTRDRRLQVESVARGKYLIALAPDVDVVADLQKAGAPIKWVSPIEGVYLSSGGSATLSYFSQAPHPNAAKVFVNWFMTKEGLTVWSQSSLTQTARRDVPTGHLYPEGIRDPKVKYFSSNKEDALLKEAEMMKLAAEIYGPLLK